MSRERSTCIPKRQALVGSLLATLFLLVAVTVIAQGVPSPGTPAPGTVLNSLTEEERAWLRDHSLLRLGVDPAWPPYEFIDSTGHYAGIAADYMKLIADRLGIVVEVQPGLSWEQVIAGLKAKVIDISPALTQTPERREFLLFAESHIKYSVAIVTRSDHVGVQELATLAGKKVALVKSYAFTEIALKSQPDIIAIYVDTVLEGLNKVSNHEAEAIVCDLPSLSYKISEYNFLNLKVSGIAPFETQGLCIGVRNDWPILVSILNKALASVSPEEHQRIRGRWAAHSAPDTAGIDLSPQEREWLTRHPVIRNMIDPDWAPIEFIDEQGRPSGITSDYLSRLEQILHIRFENPKDMSWGQMIEALKDGRLDMASCFRDTSDRRQFVNFTDAYLSMPTAIFTRADVSYADLASLRGKPVAVVEGYAVQGFLAENHPEIPLIPVRNLKDGLTLLSEGKVYAYIDALAPGSYGLTRYGFTNIRAAGETPFRYEMSMAASKQAPELASILQKGIRAVSEADRDRIYQKWSSTQISHRPDYSLVWKILVGSAGLVLVLTYWTRRLTSEVNRRRLVEAQLLQAKEELELRVKERTAELKARNVALADEILERQRTENALRENEEKLSMILNMSPLAIAWADGNGKIEFWNRKALELFGHSPQELDTLEHWFDRAYPDLPYRRQVVEQWSQLVAKAGTEGGEIEAREYDVTVADGTVRRVEISGALFGETVMAVFNDITERRHALEALRESDRQLRTVVDGAPIVLYSFDRHGVFTLSEGKGLVGLGIKPGGIVGKTIDEVYGDQPASIAALRRAMAGETFTLELSFPAGGTFEVSHIAMYDEAGDYDGTIGVLVDITERKRVEDALRRSEQRFRAIFNSTFQFTGMMTPDGILTEANQTALDFAGIRLDEVINRPFWETRWWQGDEARVRQLREAITRAAEGEFVRYEVEQQGAGETTAIIDFSLKPVFDSNGQVTLLIPEGREITERKRAEDALRESEERYRLLFSSISDAVFVHELGSEEAPGRLVEVNDVACKRLGYSREELLQMSPTDIYAPETLALVSAIMQQLVAEGHAVWEGVHIAKDGRRIPVEISDRLFELRGETVGLATVRDISERKEAEEERRRLRNYLANIIDSMPSVLVGVDTSGRVTQWNAAARARTGISSESAVGQPVDLVLPALSGELDKVKEAVRSRMVKIENRVPRMTDGQMQYLDITVYPLVSNGLEGAVIRVDDVTERVQIEEMMIQSEKMLSVGGLAAGMAHEINNPLGAILQASQNIVRRVSAELPVNLQVAKACGTTLDTVRSYLEQREVLSFLEDIRSSGLRAAKIVENMLAFSRKPEAEGSSTDLAELLERTLLLAGSDYDLKRRYDFRQIEIVRDYAPDAPLVICQAGKMQQVFFNILRNGAEAMREVRDSGRVPRFILRILSEESMVRVEIEDNGPGMDEATRKRIFEPFFTTKPPGSGTGLGLSISYFIVTEDHGGTLSVESQPGTGTRFIVRLPATGDE